MVRKTKKQKKLKEYVFKETLVPLNAIEELIEEGVAIKKSTHVGFLSGSEQRRRYPLEDRYQIWKDEATDFLRKHKISEDYDLFSDVDDVPVLTRLVITGQEDPTTVKIALIVRKEVGDKLKILRNVRDNLEKKKYKISDVGGTTQFGITLANNSVLWKDEHFPVRRGQEVMFKILFGQAEVYKGPKLIKNGESINRMVLQTKGEYKDEASFRDALRLLRNKLKKFPIEIENPTTDHYLMVIQSD